MPTNPEKIREILMSDKFSDGEKFVVRAQYRCFISMGNFEEKLWEALCAADDGNFRKLGNAFPVEASGVTAWRYGHLGDRLRAAGLEIQ